MKGQMVLCSESNTLFFIGTPCADGLESLNSKGLFISDIPLHDATRDVILVGEQARAQVKDFRKYINFIGIHIVLYVIKQYD